MGIVAAEGNMCICPRILSSVEEPWTFWLGGTKGIDSDEIVDPRTLPKGWAYIAKRSITLRTRTVAPNACAANIDGDHSRTNRANVRPSAKIQWYHKAK